MVKDNLSHNLVKELAGNVIFDEYHEFLCEQPLFAAFISYLIHVGGQKLKVSFSLATAIDLTFLLG